uniref:Uncharacterized protein n=1 Tax=Macaca fascicularis TaxID=9541 RepID=A0A7N9IF97_MACFA
MCRMSSYGILSKNNSIFCTTLCFLQLNGSRVHVHNVQVCYICILVPCCCAAPINSNFPISSRFSNL